jgi:hypothetical protein
MLSRAPGAFSVRKYPRGKPEGRGGGQPPSTAATRAGAGTGTGGKLVGAARFELTTFGTQNRRATRLRYAPLPA